MTWNIKASELRSNKTKLDNIHQSGTDLMDSLTWELSDSHIARFLLSIDQKTPVFRIWCDIDAHCSIVDLNNVEAVSLYLALKSLLGDEVDASDDPDIKIGGTD